MSAEANDVIREVNLPAPVAKRGITESEWVTLRTSLFPGAKPESVVMVIDYCRARKLDPMKKPCHIVPMQIKNAAGDYVWRDVVMPGIYEYRTTANRTGEYMGHSPYVYGPEIDYMGVKAPQSCSVTIYRFNKASGQRCEFPVSVDFSEAAATTWDKKAGEHKINSRWTKAPKQMLTKCCEAAGLREAFPDELGGTHAAEEMEGKEIIDITPRGGDPRGDEIENVDWELRDRHCSTITDLIAEYASDEAKFGEVFRDYIATRLQGFNELQIAIQDRLAADGILSRAAWKKAVKA